MKVKSRSGIRTVEQIEEKALKSSSERNAYWYHNSKGQQSLTDGLLPVGEKPVRQVNDSIIEKPEVKCKDSTNKQVNGKGQPKDIDYTRIIKNKFK